MRAGARRAFLASGELRADAVREARRLAPECDAVLLESNRVAVGALVWPGESSVGLALLGGDAAGWKESVWERIPGADALVLTGGLVGDRLPEQIRGRRCFALAAGEWCSPELVEFVRGRLLGIDH